MDILLVEGVITGEEGDDTLVLKLKTQKRRAQVMSVGYSSGQVLQVATLGYPSMKGVCRVATGNSFRAKLTHNLL